jgi:dolichyl-diphosphooligosaccharide--protein glycosyltransferase
MQFTAVAIWHALKSKLWRQVTGLKLKPVLDFLHLRGGKETLNDICVYIPAWFGGIASIMLGLLTREVSGSWRAGALGALVMSVVPAHLMRSIGGGYDNESVAVTAMCMTFFLWTRSLRAAPTSSGAVRAALGWGVLAGLASFYMAAAWGGYVFVVNLVGIHAATLFVLGHFSPQLWAAYSAWYIVGTAGAMQVPVIGQAPIRSLEQAGPLLVFLVFAFCGVTDLAGAGSGRAWPAGSGVFDIGSVAWRRAALFRAQCAVAAGVVGLAVVYQLNSVGYFGPLSVRVRALFIKHTKTGNPLVDSVAEHQAASAEAYWHHLHYTYYTIVPGLALLLLRGASARTAWALPWNERDSLAPKWFAIVYFCTAYFFANKMSRLIILMGPVAACLAGVTLAWLVEFALAQALGLCCIVGGLKFNAMLPGYDEDGVPQLASTLAKQAEQAAAKAADKQAKQAAEKAEQAAEQAEEKAAADEGSALSPAAKAARAAAAAAKPKSKASAQRAAADKEEAAKAPTTFSGLLLGAFEPVLSALHMLYASVPGKLARVAAGTLVIWHGSRMSVEFYKVSDAYARQISHPSLMFEAKLQNGETVMINDYQEAYWWLRDNTPPDSRVMSWWDYGYQINGIAKRTTIADGNTWNLEHIAMLGRMLTAPEKKAHSLVRLVADYVLIWSGGGGDDLAKSPHMARISSSVFDDVCGPSDPLCQNFGFYSEGRPTKSMEASMLYKMHSGDLKPGVTIDKKLFQEAYKSKYGLVRIWKVMNVSQETRAWLADPANRQCDRPGSWYCPGQYPPPSITGGIDLSPPSTHRHLNYDDPNAYVEDRKAKEKGGAKARAPAPSKKPKATPKAEL